MEVAQAIQTMIITAPAGVSFKMLFRKGIHANRIAAGKNGKEDAAGYWIALPEGLSGVFLLHLRRCKT